MRAPCARAQRTSRLFTRVGTLRFAHSTRPRHLAALGCKPEMHDVAVGDHVILALKPQLAAVARAGFAAERDVIVISDGLGADEAALEIGMDHARGLRRLSTVGDGPGPRLLRPGGEIGDEI